MWKYAFSSFRVISCYALEQLEELNWYELDYEYVHTHTGSIYRRKLVFLNLIYFLNMMISSFINFPGKCHYFIFLLYCIYLSHFHSLCIHWQTLSLPGSCEWTQMCKYLYIVDLESLGYIPKICAYDSCILSFLRNLISIMAAYVSSSSE